jgi:hypothetical protein
MENKITCGAGKRKRVESSGRKGKTRQVGQRKFLKIAARKRKK